MSKQAVRVQIFNQSYSLLVDGDPAEAQHLAHEIDELMYSISSRSPGDSTRVAVLACLHLADKLRAAEKQLQIFEDKSERIATLLEEVLEEQAEEALEQA
jgi:cell division protein ZapA